ncbi:unnamed protein product [Prorocentrum cordatum]|uniref:Integrase catalytic domain-containing protein n=1 Tax=Prorocentrum cordatum TaxID=2364126 RepID=A0ABN9Y936_9DINO|nr:unnamed protein product [Polarella glacialis]
MARILKLASVFARLTLKYCKCQVVPLIGEFCDSLVMAAREFLSRVDSGWAEFRIQGSLTYLGVDADIDPSVDQTAALEEAAPQVSQLPEALEVIRDVRGSMFAGRFCKSGAANIACARSAMGNERRGAHLEAAREFGTDNLIEREDICEKFVFGGRGRMGTLILKAFAIAASMRCAKADARVSKAARRLEVRDLPTGVKSGLPYGDRVVADACQTESRPAREWLAENGPGSSQNEAGLDIDDLSQRSISIGGGTPWSALDLLRDGRPLPVQDLSGGDLLIALARRPVLENCREKDSSLSQERSRASGVIKLFVGLARRAIPRGALVAIGWPWQRHGRSGPEVAELRRLFLGERGFDGTALGPAGERTGQHVKKPRRAPTKLAVAAEAPEKEVPRHIATSTAASGDAEGGGASGDPRGISAEVQSEQRVVLIRAAGKVPANSDIQATGRWLGRSVWLEGVYQTFLNQIDMATKYQIAVPAASRKPTLIWQATLDRWPRALSAPVAATTDTAAELEREVKEKHENMGSKIMSSAAYNPTQNAICERHSQTWKAHARALAPECRISFDKPEQLQ